MDSWWSKICGRVGPDVTEVLTGGLKSRTVCPERTQDGVPYPMDSQRDDPTDEDTRLIPTKSSSDLGSGYGTYSLCQLLSVLVSGKRKTLK